MPLLGEGGRHGWSGRQSGWAGPGSLIATKTLAAPITMTRPMPAKSTIIHRFSAHRRVRKDGTGPQRLPSSGAHQVGWFLQQAAVTASPESFVAIGVPSPVA